ncbi:MAG: porin family protein [Chitinophagaceae bacterium]
MQLSDNDMDELFRNAANNYPLRLPKEGWDVIAGKVSATAPVIAGIREKKRKVNGDSKKLLLSVTLLFIISGFVIFFFQNNKSVEQKGLTQRLLKEIAFDKDYSSDSKNQLKDLKRKTEALVLSFNRNKINPAIAAGSIADAQKKAIEKNERSVSVALKPVESMDEAFHELNKPGLISNFDSTKFISLSKEFEKNNKRGLSTWQNKKWYIGLSTGPQFSQVKGQGFGKNGIHTGVLSGYQFNKRLAIETGLFISQKRYYTKGNYFDMSKIKPAMPAGMELESLSGKSMVLEVPIKLKYDFVSTNKKSVFGTAGLSGYFLARESNKYQIMVNGNRQSTSGSYSGNNNPAFAIQLSAGYEYKTTKKAILRIEPFVQIPFKGMGMGSLPVMSTGINLGITIPVIR